MLHRNKQDMESYLSYFRSLGMKKIKIVNNKVFVGNFPVISAVKWSIHAQGFYVARFCPGSNPNLEDVICVGLEPTAI